MITILKVILWGEEIGRLVWDARRRLSYFNNAAAYPCSVAVVTQLFDNCSIIV